MAEEQNSNDLFKQLLKFIYDFLKPAITAFEDPDARQEYFGTLGLSSSGGTVNFPDATNLENYINRESQEVDSFALIGAMADLAQIIAAIEGVIRAAVDGGGDPDFVADEVISSVFTLLLTEHLRREYPRIYAVLTLVPIITEQTAAEGGFSNFYDELIKPFFEGLGQGLNNEEGVTSWSISSFAGLGGLIYFVDWLVKKYTDTLLEFSLGYGYEGVEESTTPNADTITNRFMSYGIRRYENPDVTFVQTMGYVPEDQGGIAFLTELAGLFDIKIDLTDKISLGILTEGDGVFRIGEGADASLGENNKVSLTFKQDRSDASMWALMDSPQIKLGFGTYTLNLNFDKKDFAVKAKFEMPFFFGKGDNTGFPWSFLPEKIDEKIPIPFGYSLKNGFFFGDNAAGNSAENPDTAAAAAPGNAGSDKPDFVEGLVATILNKIDLRIPIYKTIGDVVSIEILNLRTGVQGNFDAFALETSLDFSVKMGSVLELSISRLGFELLMEKAAEGSDGDIFGYNIHPKIKPPNGAGVVVDASMIKGGGYLYFDDEKGEYFGALELEFKELFTLKAVGIINTIMPDGSKGFSMLIIITAEFTPVQLGFGFTLSGVGGLLGIDRRADVEILRQGLRTNAIKSVLFPEDVVGNINRIINDLRQIFPVQKDTFLIGLMAQLGWSNNLLKIELGVILELMDPKILILGVIKLSLPDENAEVLRLQVNFLGVIDFQNKFVYFEAQLFESMVFGFPLTGSLAFGVGWGDTAMFGISVGGFHPDFRDYPVVPTLPGAFRDMVRIGLSLLKGGNPRLTLEAYFAVTSNSLQFGAKLELLAEGPMGFNLYGMLAFDALFIFDPFSFIISLEATLAIRKGTSILFGIHFKGVLSGPNPWHVEGSVTFGILFFDVTISFSSTWGDPPASIASTTSDLKELLLKEVNTIANWKAKSLNGQGDGVSLKDVQKETGHPLILSPFGALDFLQSTIPLNLEMQKYGNNTPAGENYFSIKKIMIGTEAASFKMLKSKFAAGNYLKLTEKEKLNRKSFEPFDGGFELEDSGNLATASPELDPTILNYEVNYTSDDKPQLHKLPKGAFLHLNRNAASAKSSLSWQFGNKAIVNKPGKVQFNAGNTYTLANMENMKEYDMNLRSGTRAEINAKFEKLVSEKPELKNQLQIVEEFELN